MSCCVDRHVQYIDTVLTCTRSTWRHYFEKRSNGHFQHCDGRQKQYGNTVDRHIQYGDIVDRHVHFGGTVLEDTRSV